MSRVRIAGIGMTAHGRSEHGPGVLVTEAAQSAVRDADVEAGQIALIIVSNALGGLLSDQECIRGQSWLQGAGLGTAPIINVDNGCAGGSSALHLGWMAVQAGQGPVLVVGVEKMWTGDRAGTLNGIENCLAADQRYVLRETVAGAAGSVFMGLNAGWAESQMRERGHTTEQFAVAAVKSRRHGALNPLAQHRSEVTTDEVLESPEVEGCLTRLMCSSFTDGAAAVVLASKAIAGAPVIRASVARSGDESSDYHTRLTELAELAYDAAGVGPSEIDAVELHDATSAEELYALECLRFYEDGEAGIATMRGDTTFGTKTAVVNPSGGLVARGHPLGATGLDQVVEISLHLRGEAGDRQIEGAHMGMAVNTGGIISGDVGSICVHVLERG